MDQVTNDIYDFIFKIDRRIGYLEKDLSVIDRKIGTLDLYEKNMYKNLHEELASARLFIEKIKEKIKSVSIGLSSLSSEMKEVVKIEQSDSLSKQVDNIPIHEFITKKELKNI